MAAAGVVGMAEVVQPSSVSTQGKLAGTPAMWAFVWVGAAMLFLLTLHVAMVGRGRR